MFLEALMVCLILFIINSVTTCTVPSLDENVSSSCSTGTSVSYNDLCSLSCPTGFNLIGASSVTCTISGSFSQAFPVCEGKCNKSALWYIHVGS